MILARLAVRAPAPVFVVAGAGGGEALRGLRLSGEVEVVDSPRAANVLFIAGALPPRLLKPALRVHDQMSHPRGTLIGESDTGSADLTRWFPSACVDASPRGPLDAIRSLHSDLLHGRRASEAPLQPDHPPVPWRGRGPYGQGGKGMTGGAPYGRPLAERAPDRDLLELDRLALRVGPFFPAFPPGLVLDVTLQGDVIQEAKIGPNPFGDCPQDAAGDPFLRALRAPVPIVELELARARSHIRWLAEALRLQGLGALGLRALSLSESLTIDRALSTARGLASLWRRVRRWRSVGWATKGVGVIGAEGAADMTGPVARAAGIEADARSEDPGYLALGFRPVTRSAGDALARWEQRVAEAVQALDLAARAGDGASEGRGTVESPRGRLTVGARFTGSAATRLPEVLPGLEWGDAVVTVASLDLDLEAEARARASLLAAGDRPG